MMGDLPFVDFAAAAAFTEYVNELCERLSIALFEAGYPVEEITLGFPVDVDDEVVGEGTLSVALVDPDLLLPDEVLAKALTLAMPGELALGKRLFKEAE